MRSPVLLNVSVCLTLGSLLGACSRGEPSDRTTGGTTGEAAPAEAPATADMATPAESSPNAPVTPLPALEGSEWFVVELEGAPPPDRVEATLTLDREAGQATGSGGCNRYTGAYDLAGARLTFGTMANTRMACPADAMIFEGAYLAALGSVGSYRLTGSTLDLLGETGAVVRLRAR